MTKKASKQVVTDSERAEEAGERRYWLVKTEPDVFSFEDLQNAENQRTYWDGVRNYQARNFMRDEMKLGDGVLVYHSNAKPPGIAGVAKVVREAYPDHTQFDPDSPYFAPKSKAESPTWIMVDIQAVAPLPRYLPLPELREYAPISGMELLRKGSRLSVQPVSKREWDEVLALAGLKADPLDQ